MEMEFDRWRSKSGTTWVQKIFKKHHTLLNSLYWSYIPVASYGDYLYRNNDKVGTTQELFHASGEDAHRIDSDLDQWYTHAKDFENWTRLNALVALTSNFEVYLSSVVSLAIESDPGLVFETSRVIDGLTLLKKNNQKGYSFYHISETITKGDWWKRTTAFKKTFGSIPKILEDNIGELDKIRILRNNITHAFGREIEKAQARGVIEVLEMERLSLIRLKKYMNMIERIVKEIDNQLVENHIGDYETVYYFHQIKDSLPEERKFVALRKNLNALGINGTCNEQYCIELVDYYNKI